MYYFYIIQIKQNNMIAKITVFEPETMKIKSSFQEEYSNDKELDELFEYIRSAFRHCLVIMVDNSNFLKISQITYHAETSA